MCVAAPPARQGMAVRSPVGSRGGQSGFTYLGVLLAVALIGLGLVTASEVWMTVAHRHKLEQLEFAGQQYAQAIGSYYESTPGAAKQYPRSLEDLLEDRRFPSPRRHLRRIYLNPFETGQQWEVVAGTGGGIAGVRALIPFAGVGEQRVQEFRYP